MPKATVLTVLALLAGGATGEALGQSAPQLLEFQVIYSEKGPNGTSAGTTLGG